MAENTVPSPISVDIQVDPNAFGAGLPNPGEPVAPIPEEEGAAPNPAPTEGSVPEAIPEEATPAAATDPFLTPLDDGDDTDDDGTYDEIEVEDAGAGMFETITNWLAGGAKAGVDEMVYAFQGINPGLAHKAMVASEEVQALYSETGVIPARHFLDPADGKIKLVINTDEDELEDSAPVALGRIFSSGILTAAVRHAGVTRSVRVEKLAEEVEEAAEVAADAALAERQAVEGATEGAGEVASETVATERALGDAVEQATPPGDRPDVQAETAAAKERAKTREFLTHDQITLIRDRMREVREGKIAFEDTGLGDIINFDYTASGDGALHLIKVLGQQLSDTLTAARGGTRTFEETAALAEIIQTNPMALTQRLKGLAKSTEEMDAIVVGAKIYLQALADKISKLGLRVDASGDTTAMEEMTAALQHLANVAIEFGGLRTNIARAQNAQKIITGGEDAVGVVTTDLLEIAKAGKLRPRDAKYIARKMRLAQGRAHTVMAGSRPSGISRAMDVFNEYYINALLSGPKTFNVNFVSTALNTYVVQPLQRSLAGVMIGDPRMMREGATLLAGHFLTIKDSLKMASRAIKIEDQILDPFTRINEISGSKKIFWGDGQLRGNGTLGFIINGTGQFVRSPSRFLLTADEFFKQQNYRAFVRMQALREADTLGLTGKAKAAHVYDSLQHAFDGTGRATNTDALQFARRSTYTDRLEAPAWIRDRTFGEWLQDGVNKIPYLRVISPFVGTPVNLFRRAHEMTPILGLARREMWQDIAAGGVRRGNALAKQAMGMSIMSGSSYLAAAGILTGGGPQDPELNKIWRETHQPYSINLGTPDNPSWWSYRRLDPLSTLVGGSADLVEMTKDTARRFLHLDPDSAELFGLIGDMVDASSEISAKEYEELGLNVLTAISRNVTNKNFTGPLVENIEALLGGETWKLQKFAGRFAGSLVPNALNQLNPDPHFREARTIMDEVRKRIPGYSRDLPARKNIFAQPVLKPVGTFNRSFNPFTNVRGIREPIMKDLLELGNGISMPEEVIFNGQIDLTDAKWADKKGVTPYDRAIDIMGPQLLERVRSAVDSGAWEAWSKGTPEFPGGQRRLKVIEWRTKYWQQALKQVAEENPKFGDAFMVLRHTKRAAERGGQDLVDELRDALQ